MSLHGLLGIFTPSQEDDPANLSPLKERLLEVADRYQDQLPTHLRMMLKGFLPNFNSVDDEQLLTFIAHIRAILDYVETGEVPQPIEQ